MAVLVTYIGAGDYEVSVRGKIFILNADELSEIIEVFEYEGELFTEEIAALTIGG